MTKTDPSCEQHLWFFWVLLSAVSTPRDVRDLSLVIPTFYSVIENTDKRFSELQIYD